MKKFSIHYALFLSLLFIGFTAMAQQGTGNSQTSNQTQMKTFLIERDIPNAGKLTPEQLKAISQTSCKVLREMGPTIQWVESYVTKDKIYCVYRAENAELIREHAKKGGFPANVIMEIGSVISPATASAN